MFLGHLRESREKFPSSGRILCVDHGEKTLGLAVSDAGQGVATPLLTLRRTKMKQDIQALQPILNDYAVRALIFGYPLDQNGNPGKRAQSVSDYARALADQLTLPICLWDERFSTAAVDRFMVETVDMSRTKRKQNVDKLAAQFILQGALDYLRTA